MSIPEGRWGYVNFFSQQDAVLLNLRTFLPNMTTLNVTNENIKIIDGQWEGIYNWISINYLEG